MRAFSSNGQNTLYCRADVDTSIVSTVLDFVCAGENVCLIEADTDPLIMLDLYVKRHDSTNQNKECGYW